MFMMKILKKALDNLPNELYTLYLDPELQDFILLINFIKGYNKIIKRNLIQQQKINPNLFNMSLLLQWHLI